MKAEARGLEMMLVPMNQLPQLALDFARRLCSEVGMCSETLLTAWTVYAQEVEGLECTDTLYFSRQVDKEWFAGQKLRSSYDS